jgi:hypothetical protein
MSGSRRKLGPFVDGYRAWLVGRGYSPSVVIRSLVTLGHLGRWLERNALAVDLLTAKAVSGFLAEYRDDRGRLPGASLWPLLEYLRAEGAVPPEPPAVETPASPENRSLRGQRRGVRRLSLGKRRATSHRSFAVRRIRARSFPGGGDRVLDAQHALFGAVMSQASAPWRARAGPRNAARSLARWGPRFDV